MANLFTHHDPMHFHAFLGLCSLLHFVYRISTWVQTGHTFPPNNMGLGVDLMCIALHLALQATSFLLPLPKQRFMSKPMVWPEFRMHSCVFTVRCALSCVTLLVVREYQLPAVYGQCINAAIVVAAMRAATWVTDNYGSNTNRTTNSMAYPDECDKNLEKNTKYFYVQCQLWTSALCLYDIDGSFLTVLGIQIAPLMMTLVRKGKINTEAYHLVYYAALYFNFIRLWCNFVNGNDLVTTSIVAAVIMDRLRREARLSKYATFLIAFFFSALLGPYAEALAAPVSMRYRAIIAVLCTCPPYMHIAFLRWVAIGTGASKYVRRIKAVSQNTLSVVAEVS